MSVLFELTTEDDSIELMKRLIQIRWIIAFSMLVIMLLAIYLLPENLHLKLLLIPIILLAGLNIVFYVYFYIKKSPVLSAGHWLFFTHFQMIFDIISLTIFLHFLGGLETYFFFLYLIYIVIAGFLFERKICFAYTAFVNLIFFGLLALEWQKIIPHYNLSNFRFPLRFQQPLHIFSTSFTLLVTSFLATYIISTMIKKLKERERELMEMNVACELKTRELIEANLACELKTKELAEANLSCELKTKELADLNEKLEKIDRTRTQFIWAVTHEMRAPISAIQSYMNLILQGYIPPEKIYDVVQKAERQAQRQLDLINDLLQLSQLEDPNMQINAEPVDISKILEEVVEPMSAIAEEKGITLCVNLDGKPAIVNANQEHIKSLWTNLINNAVKYTNNGGQVNVMLFQDTDNVVGVVEDNGIGISETCLPHIFDQFYRASNAKSMTRNGTGLGLSIVKRILETYGGNITVESKLGEGTKFTFILPKLKEE